MFFRITQIFKIQWAEMVMSQKTVFVTGGTGKIGRYLVPRLCALGFFVKVLTRHADNPWPKTNNIQIIKGDLCDEQVVKNAIHGCNYVFHLAVYQNANDRNIDLFRRVNIEGTKAILNSSLHANIKKLVYVSTAMVYEATGKIAQGENWIQKKSCSVDNYIQTKLEALLYVREMQKQLPIVIVYPTAVIDLKDFPASAPVHQGRLQRFIWERVGGGIPGGIVNLIGSKERVFNYVVVEDLVEGIILAATKSPPGEEYLLGGKNINVGNYLYSAACRMNKKVFPVRFPLFIFKLIALLVPFIFLPPIIKLIAQSGGLSMCFSSEKAEKNLGYQIKLTL